MAYVLSLLTFCSLHDYSSSFILHFLHSQLPTLFPPFLNWQLSLCSNNLVDISAVSSLTRLVTLNLQNNSITVIEGLDSLTQLEWLGLAGNSIKVYTYVMHCIRKLCTISA